jgi:hypothetical protein
MWDSNAREAHPIFFHHVLKGIRNGARMYTVDPRRSSTAQWADAGLANEEFIRRARSTSTNTASPSPGTRSSAPSVTQVSPRI